MTKHRVTSRREFVQFAGLTAGAISLGQISASRAAEQSVVDRSPDAVLGRLVEGNQRFARGQSTRVGRRPQDFVLDAQGQTPVAAIVACADSRVAPELVFDQGVGLLRGMDPILSEFVKAGKVKVVGGVYELGTGVVEVCA